MFLRLLKESNLLTYLRRTTQVTLLIVCLLVAGGCGVVAKTRKVKESERPKAAQTATLEELVQRVNAQAEGIHSYQAKVRFTVHSGSLTSGELKDYHEIKGFVLYRFPDHLRMIGQIPSFGVSALDMVSDGHQFRVAFAPYKKFIIGSAFDHPHSKKPLENLRPIHILEALQPIAISPASENRILFREEVSEGRDNFYVIYELARTRLSTTSLYRKLWIDRSDLALARQQLFSADGVLESDARYAEYTKWGDVAYPKVIDLVRKQEEYGLTILFDDIKFNLPLDDAKFELVQPEGYEVIEAGKKSLMP
jgi:outer membrane lipoprotein-sorting protein